MHQIRSILFFGFIFLVSCDKEPDATPILSVEVGYIDSDLSDELWIFASDVEGRLVDIQKLSRGTNFLKSVRQDLSQVDLTIVSMLDGNYNFTTYNDLPLDRTVKVNTFFQTNATINQVDFELANYSEGDPSTTLSISGGAGGLNSSLYNASTGNFNGVIMVEANAGKLLISGKRNGTSVYSLTEGIKSRMTLKLDFNDFKPVENFIPIPEATNVQVLAQSNSIPTGGDFVIHRASADLNEAPLEIAYVPGFDYYVTNIQKQTQSPWTSYSKSGPPLSSFTWPNVTLVVNSESQQDFSVNCSMPVDRIQTSSIHSFNLKSATWTVYAGPGGGAIRPNIPPMFLSRLDAKSKEDFKLIGGEITCAAGSLTHQDLLEERLYDGTRKREFEYFKFYF